MVRWVLHRPLIMSILSVLYSSKSQHDWVCALTGIKALFYFYARKIPENCLESCYVPEIGVWYIDCLIFMSYVLEKPLWHEFSKIEVIHIHTKCLFL